MQEQEQEQEKEQEQEGGAWLPGPCEFQDWPASAAFQQHCAAFSPFVARRVAYPNSFRPAHLLEHARHQEEGEEDAVEVEVACAQLGLEFSGDAQKSDSVRMSLRTYMEGFDACRRGEKHWISDVSGIDLYLSQLTVLSSSGKGALTGQFLPEILQSSEVNEANAWVNINSVSTSLHYDGNHNVLYVHCGCKEVLLVSPVLTPHLQPRGAHACTPNHSGLNRTELLSVLMQLSRTPQFYESKDAGPTAFRVVLDAGDCLFIPEGWWHQVSSHAGTFATNFWFGSPMHRCLMGPTGANMAPYLLRAAVHEILSVRLAGWKPSEEFESLSSTVGSSPYFCISDFSYPNDLLSNPEAYDLLNSRQIQCLRDIGGRFSGSNWAEMKSYWVKFASRNSGVWSYVLLHLNDAECFAVVRTWESAEIAEEQMQEQAQVARGSNIDNIIQNSCASGRGPHGKDGVQEICLALLVTCCGSESMSKKVKDHIIQSKDAYVQRFVESVILPEILGVALPVCCDDKSGRVDYGLRSMKKGVVKTKECEEALVHKQPQAKKQKLLPS